MISVEQIVLELLRIEGNIPDCAARCGQCSSTAMNTAGALGPFGGEDRGARACLSIAANQLDSAKAELEQLRASVQNEILQLKA